MREKVIIFSNSRNFVAKLSYYSQKTIWQNTEKKEKTKEKHVRNNKNS